MRFAPGFPIRQLVVSGSGCTISIDAHGSDGYKVVTTLNETLLTKFGKSEIEALERIAAELDRTAASVRELIAAIKKAACA
jgi:hypothetical protein